MTKKQDHSDLSNTRRTRRYFDKFERITGHLARVAGVMEAEGRLSKDTTEILTRYVTALTFTFRALGHKYMFAGRASRAGQLTFDKRESGLPIAAELLEMAVDASQARKHLASLPSKQALKEQMVAKIVGDQEIPTKLQYSMSQRLYYEEMVRGDLFWARNDPEIAWVENLDNGRRAFRIHWAVYDSDLNLPTIYIMDLEDSGRTPLPKDDRRWPEVQAHLIAQAMGSLKLITIARGFDADFDDLHPKKLRRFHLGPMYSSAFTEQDGPLRQVLEQAQAPAGEDWALVWTVETLLSDRVNKEKSGWFGSVDREVFALDMFAEHGVSDIGATSMDRAVIMPQRPYQALEDLNPPGFSRVRKFVVSPSGRVLSYR